MSNEGKCRVIYIFKQVKIREKKENKKMAIIMMVIMMKGESRGGGQRGSQTSEGRKKRGEGRIIGDVRQVKGEERG